MAKETDRNKADVLSFNSARNEQIEEKRLNYERVLFRNVLGVYSVMEQKRGLHAIELLDISDKGMSFQLPINSDMKPEVGDILNIRLYFASESFLPVAIKIVRVLDSISDGVPVHRYGCEIDTTFKSYQAVHYLYRFIKACAEHGHVDTDHLKIFY